MSAASGNGEGVNAGHRTGPAPGASGPVSPVHGAFQHSMLRRCFNHDYRDPFFYMVTVTTHERRPWFGVCENNACVLNADGWLVHNLWHRISQDYPQIAISTLCIMPDHLHGILHVSRKATESEIETLREEVLAEATQGTVIVSPFISPGEREIATAILAAPVGDVILLKPGGFPPLFKPNGRYFNLCVQGRLLFLSRPAAAVHGDTPLTRETCLELNAACAHLADGQTTEDHP